VCDATKTVLSDNEIDVDGACSELTTVSQDDRAWPSTIQLCDRYEQVAPLCAKTFTQLCFYNEDPPTCDTQTNDTTYSIDEVQKTCASPYYLHLKDVVFEPERHAEVLSEIRSPAFVKR